MNTSDGAAFLDHIEASIARSEASRGDHRFLLVFDFSEMKPPNAAQRNRYIEFMEERRGRVADRLLATVVVHRSAVIRGVLTAINWVRPFPVPPSFVADLAEAQNAASRLLADAGIVWHGNITARPFQRAV